MAQSLTAASLETPARLAGNPAGTAQSASGANGADIARSAGLRYVTDARPGIRRRRRGRGFSYLDAAGRPLRDRQQRQRIAALAIPPAWTDVWICASADGHLQATGRDARGRKQYRYHPDWRAVRDETKFDRLVAFGEALPHLRARLERDLERPGLPREKVLAVVVRLLETTLIRIGNEEYARENRSFGLTTLRNRHVTIAGAKLNFHFRGKSGQEHDVTLSDRRVARVVRACRDLPGQELFQYLDEAGERQTVDSADVNGYLREATGLDFTAKDFRTWGGTVLALSALQTIGGGDPKACRPAADRPAGGGPGAGGPAGGSREANHAVVEAVRQVARQLGNRPAVCRKYYVHPAVIAAFLSGQMAPPNVQRVQRLAAAAPEMPTAAECRRALEERTLALLRRMPPCDPPPRVRRARRPRRGQSQRSALIGSSRMARRAGR